ncbi:hypothetical protein AcW2_001196 [Taiwanofungus camphoratus]|nr:hypothetical protein AcW2_001196 [Antrodia cinnamomea]
MPTFVPRRPGVGPTKIPLRVCQSGCAGQLARIPRIAGTSKTSATSGAGITLRFPVSGGARSSRVWQSISPAKARKSPLANHANLLILSAPHVLLPLANVPSYLGLGLKTRKSSLSCPSAFFSPRLYLVSTMRVQWFSLLSLALLAGFTSAAPAAAPALEQRDAYDVAKRDVQSRQESGGPGSW